MKISRREFTIQALGTGAALGLGNGIRSLATPSGFGAHVLRIPDTVSVEFEEATERATRSGTSWGVKDAVVETLSNNNSLAIRLRAPSSAVRRVRIVWNAAAPASARILNDHWERGYGDLSWQPVNSERILPWYTVVYDGKVASGFGVLTQPAALCSWRITPEEIHLICDVRSGQNGVRLGQRTLDVATVVAHTGSRRETPFLVAKRLCRALCGSPLLPDHVVYGTNDWYFNYGKNSREQTLRDASIMAELTAGIANRPYSVIDGGWQETGGAGGGPWDRPASKFGDMADLARKLRDIGVRPGIWLRLLETKESLPATWFRAPSTRLLDPSVPEVLDLLKRAVHRTVNEWGYDLIKHDYSSADIFGRWGFQMGEAMYNPKAPSFQDRSRTTAEIVLAFFRAIRAGAGRAVIIGCNTLSHLAAGFVELQRTGDDTSGREWARTRKMGVNTLAFRMPQHKAFYDADTDCVPITDKVPWHLSRQWLDVVSRSGTPLFVSLQSDLITGQVREALRIALRRASQSQPAGEPLDWLDTLTPRRWRFGKETIVYNWEG